MGKTATETAQRVTLAESISQLVQNRVAVQFVNAGLSAIAVRLLRHGHSQQVEYGHPEQLTFTHPDDLDIAEAILAKGKSMCGEAWESA